VETTTKGIRRILIVAVLALVAFGAAIVVLGDEARLGCATDAPPGPAYRAQVLGPVETERTSYEIAVSRDGQPVSGAKVCAHVAKVGRAAMGFSETAVEASPGTYRVALVLEVSGRWSGSVHIAEEGQAAVSVPLSFVAA
jgi:hypothetical protein